MKAERQSKRASCDIMAAMRAMHVRLCGLGYVEPTARAAGPTTSKQQSMRLAMGQPGLLPGCEHGRAATSSRLQLGARRFWGKSDIDTCTPTARRRRAKKILTVAEGEATPLPPYPPPGRG